MPLQRIHSFLVHPAKLAEEQPAIRGTNIHRRGPFFEMLKGVFARAPEECDIDIVFQPDKAGNQQNECRDALVKYVQESTVAHGRAIRFIDFMYNTAPHPVITQVTDNTGRPYCTRTIVRATSLAYQDRTPICTLVLIWSSVT